MRSMFVAQWFDGKDRDLVTQVGEILYSHGMGYVTGRVAGGGHLDDAIKQKITACDGLVALATRREELAGGGWTTHPWVMSEFEYAKGQSTHVIALVEGGVRWEGMHAGHEYIPLERERVSEALLRLSRTLGEWKENAGKLVKLRVHPDELAERLKNAGPRFRCRCRFLERGNHSDWRDITLVPEPGSVFLYVPGVRDSQLIEVEVRSDNETWRSPATPQFMPIELERAG
jgi:hypothetical protein